MSDFELWQVTLRHQLPPPRLQRLTMVRRRWGKRSSTLPACLTPCSSEGLSRDVLRHRSVPAEAKRELGESFPIVLYRFFKGLSTLCRRPRGRHAGSSPPDGRDRQPDPGSPITRTSSVDLAGRSSASPGLLWKPAAEALAVDGSSEGVIVVLRCQKAKPFAEVDGLPVRLPSPNTVVRKGPGDR